MLKERKRLACRRASGGITVFLTGMLVIFMTFVLACVDAVRTYVIRVEAECIAQMGLDSVFAEYNRELLDRYDLFLLIRLMDMRSRPMGGRRRT